MFLWTECFPIFCSYQRLTLDGKLVLSKGNVAGPKLKNGVEMQGRVNVVLCFLG